MGGDLPCGERPACPMPRRHNTFRKASVHCSTRDRVTTAVYWSRLDLFLRRDDKRSDRKRHSTRLLVRIQYHHTTTIDTLRPGMHHSGQSVSWK
jgi:hypothetical protein